MFEIIPAPGTEDKEWPAIEKKLELVKPFAKSVHIDILDGKFANNTTFNDPEPYKTFADTFLLEVHLMVEEPITYLEKFAAAGFKRFIGHVEKMSDQAEFVAEAQQYGDVGLAVDGPSSLDALKVSLLDIDTLLIMTIQAGFSGQKFQLEQLEKVRKIAEQSTGLLPIEVDGGIGSHTIADAFKAGASRFVATSAIYGHQDPKAAYHKLHDTCNALLEEKTA